MAPKGKANAKGDLKLDDPSRAASTAQARKRTKLADLTVSKRWVSACMCICTGICLRDNHSLQDQLRCFLARPLQHKPHSTSDLWTQMSAAAPCHHGISHEVQAQSSFISHIAALLATQHRPHQSYENDNSHTK